MPRLQGEALAPKENVEPARRFEVTPDGIAIIPIMGTLVRRTVGLEALSGLTSYAELSEQLMEAVSDPFIRAILLDIDSPGGEAGGVFDLADQIYAARQVKPVWAVANEEAFSAAYALAASAERLYVPRTGGVGSIGVIAVHLDQSEADAEEGLKYTAIFAGEHKDDFSQHKPLADPARDSLQKEVNRIYGLFVQSVARGRGMDVDALRATEAALFFGDEAKAAGLADKLGTFDVALADLSSFLSTTLNRKDVFMTKPKETPTAQAQEQAPDIAASQEELFKQAKAEGFAEAKAYMDEVKDLCSLAGAPEKADAFIEKTVPLADVRKALLEAKAKQAEATEIAGHIPAPSPSGEAKIDTAAIYAARNNLKTQSRL
ncbi:MAG: S49 family peptidase [Alphaproteobacteria bacterium]|nr:S49 family peptidase [Alphaproteobacteria bacterium]